MARPNQARLSLCALRNNLALARSLAPGSKIMAVVKANAYGHGALTIAGALEPLVDAMAVACIEEAVALRNGGIRAPILLLQGAFEASELDTAVQHDLWLTVANEQQLAWLEQARLPAPLQCWLKLDTGMHRLGIDADDVSSFYARLRASGNVQEQIVVCTHFASADELDSKQTAQQLRLFESLSQDLDAPRSAANSAGVLAWPAAHYQWIRPGYMLYGNSPFRHAHANTRDLQPVMTLVSAVTALRHVSTGEAVGYGANWVAQRPSRIATVTIGYGDGYPRLAANGTPVLVNGQRAALAGRVSMDMITLDVTDLEHVSVGDEVILWGPGLPVDEVARHCDTIGYELTTRMPARTPRTVTES
jgi:alanine racemase